MLLEGSSEKVQRMPESCSWARHVPATEHPSSILRALDPEARHAQMKEFVRDMTLVASILNGGKVR